MLDVLAGLTDEFIGGAVVWLIDLLIKFLPLSPFVGLNLEGLPAQSLGWLNWFVDVGAMCDLLAAWLVCISIYMVLHKILEVINSDSSILKKIGGIVRPISGG